MPKRHAAARRSTTSSTEPLQRVRRERKARQVYSPSVELRDRPPAKRQQATSGSSRSPSPPQVQAPERSRSPSVAATTGNQQGEQPKRRRGRACAPSTPLHKQLETRIAGQVKKLKFNLTFVEAYEQEGWRRASMDKLKPSDELIKAQKMMLQLKREIRDSLLELRALNEHDPKLIVTSGPAPGSPDDELTGVAYEHIVCARCGGTEDSEDNDILLCDNPGCDRAYHQQCQNPIVPTASIPEGDVEWFCEVCHAVFESLKKLNYALGTTYDTVDEVFPYLEEEEEEARQLQAAAAAPRSTLTDMAWGDDEDEEDDDFVPEQDIAMSDDDAETSRPATSESDDSDCSSDEEENVVEEEKDVDASELEFLHKGDVLDETRRTTRSGYTGTSSSAPRSKDQAGLVGAKVARLDVMGDLVFGVVLEHVNPTGHGPASHYRILYYDGIQQVLDAHGTTKVIKRAAQNADCEMHEDEPDDRLIVHGKRKRTPVDYRELNERMFANQADDDDANKSDDDYVLEQDETAHEDEDVYSPSHATTPQARDGRSRRARNKVDYNALNEGLLGY
ncbi:TPA: hypothetical protein N0F65_005156 [Lagenidium giganteum]|uniref:PHD-type domain-containing protein n=1 Tax=Lagenidium giganteum TaxID=4803 RepID=A0AAV2YVX0_9STRA|nr:TPA: hypothetical protein N0F65_005156 [Lagenidium giganteum]